MSFTPWYRDISALLDNPLSFLPFLPGMHPYEQLNASMRYAMLVTIALFYRYPRVLVIPLFVAAITLVIGKTWEDGEGNIIGSNGLPCQAPSALNPTMGPMYSDSPDRKQACSIRDPEIRKRVNDLETAEYGDYKSVAHSRTYDDPEQVLTAAERSAAMTWIYPPGSFRSSGTPPRII